MSDWTLRHSFRKSQCLHNQFASGHSQSHGKVPSALILTSSLMQVPVISGTHFMVRCLAAGKTRKYGSRFLTCALEEGTEKEVGMGTECLFRTSIYLEEATLCQESQGRKTRERNFSSIQEKAASCSGKRWGSWSQINVGAVLTHSLLALVSMRY